MFIRNSTFCFLPNNSEKPLVLTYSALDALNVLTVDAIFQTFQIQILTFAYTHLLIGDE